MKVEQASEEAHIPPAIIPNTPANETEEIKNSIHANGQFIFQGDANAFSILLKSLPPQTVSQITHCSAVIMGEETKPGNAHCLILTFILGVLCIFPFLLFCCQWWKRAVSQVFRIEETTYRELAQLTESPKLQSVQITVYDNYLTHKKINILSKALSRSTAVSLRFCNEAGAFDMLSEEHSNFLINAKPLSRLKLKEWEIRWYRSSLSNV